MERGAAVCGDSASDSSVVDDTERSAAAVAGESEGSGMERPTLMGFERCASLEIPTVNGRKVWPHGRSSGLIFKRSESPRVRAERSARQMAIKWPELKI